MGRKITLAALAGSVGTALAAGALSADRTVVLLAEESAHIDGEPGP